MATKRLSDKTSLNNSFKMGMGAASAAVPNTPTIGTATKTGATTATVTYTAAVLGALGSTFTATSSPSSITGTGSSPITVSGLTGSTNYTFTVTATNANGTSAASSASNQITTDVSGPPVSGYSFWLDADDATTFTFSSSNVVSAWADKSGNANNATQATVVNQPTKESSVLNGKAVVRFTATKLLKTGTKFGGQAQTTFMVINTASGIDNASTGSGSPLYSSLGQVTNLAAGGMAFGSWTGGYANERINWTVQTSGNSTNGVAYTSANISSGGHTLCFVTGSSGSGRDILLDNSSLSLTAVSNWNTSNYPGNYDCIGNTDSATDGFKGDIAEIIFYPSQLSGSDITSVNNYLKTKWGTP